MALGVVKACSTQPLPSVRVDEIQQGDLRPEGQIAGVTGRYPLPTSKCVWGALWGVTIFLYFAVSRQLILLRLYG